MNSVALVLKKTMICVDSKVVWTHMNWHILKISIAPYQLKGDFARNLNLNSLFFFADSSSSIPNHYENIHWYIFFAINR